MRAGQQRRVIQPQRRAGLQIDLVGRQLSRHLAAAVVGGLAAQADQRLRTDAEAVERGHLAAERDIAACVDHDVAGMDRVVRGAATTDHRVVSGDLGHQLRLRAIQRDILPDGDFLHLLYLDQLLAGLDIRAVVADLLHLLGHAVGQLDTLVVDRLGLRFPGVEVVLEILVAVAVELDRADDVVADVVAEPRVVGVIGLRPAAEVLVLVENDVVRRFTQRHRRGDVIPVAADERDLAGVDAVDTAAVIDVLAQRRAVAADGLQVVG